MGNLIVIIIAVLLILLVMKFVKNCVKGLLILVIILATVGYLFVNGLMPF